MNCLCIKLEKAFMGIANHLLFDSFPPHQKQGNLIHRGVQLHS